MAVLKQQSLQYENFHFKFAVSAFFTYFSRIGAAFVNNNSQKNINHQMVYLFHLTTFLKQHLENFHFKFPVSAFVIYFSRIGAAFVLNNSQKILIIKWFTSFT